MNNSKAVTKTNPMDSSKVRRITQIGMLSALATVLMYFDVPLPFLAPTFYKLDLSELPVLIGTFAMGPVAGIIIELVKNLLILLLKGTQTAFVGELANFLIGCSFILPAGIFYKRKQTKKMAIVGMASGTIFMAAVGCILNAYLLLPAYAAAFHMPIEAFIEMGSAINSSVNSLLTFVVLTVAPFNIVKGVVISVITFFLYKHISRFLKA